MLDLPKPHGFLIWHGKQTGIAAVQPLELSDGPALLTSGGEAYGHITLSQPAQMTVKEFDRLGDKHRMRPIDRKMLWPEAKALYIYDIKEFVPFDHPKPIENGEVIDYEPTYEERQAIKQISELPKVITLIAEAVTLEPDGLALVDGLKSEELEKALKAVGGIDCGEKCLPLYSLALVRLPRLAFKEKKSEVSMPYKPVANHPGCKGKVGVINTDTGELKGCSDNMDMAKQHMAALYAAEQKKEAGVAEGEKCGDMCGPMGGPTSFAEMMALEAAQEAAGETKELTYQFQMIAGNIMASDLITDKAAALASLANEYAGLVQEAVAQKASEEPEEGDKATWSGAMVNNLPDSSFLFIESGGEKDEEGKTKPRSLRHLPYKDASGKVDLPHLRAAASRLGQSGTGTTGGESWLTADVRKRLQSKVSNLLEENKGEPEVAEDEKVGRRMNKSMMDRLKSAYDMMAELLGWAQGPEEDDDEDEMKAFAIKTVNGHPWFVAYSTNAFQDREGEIFSTKSLEKYVTEAEQKQDRGAFNFWHIPGSDFAKKEWQGVVGRFLVEAGPFTDDEKGQAALKFFKEFPDGHPEIAPEGWGCSPEYRYLPEERKSGIYENIWITRTSALPRLAAANIWTNGGVTMALSEAQQKAAKTIFGESLAAQIVAKAEDKTKELEQAGVAHKDTAQQQPIEIPIDEIAQKILGQLEADFRPFAESLAALAAKVDELGGEVKSLKKTEEVKAENELPRFVFKMLQGQQASQSEKTVVPEGDALRNQKPVEAKPTDKSGAAYFFPAK